MTTDSQYVILVDRRDSEKLRQFQNGQFNESATKFLSKHDSNFVWGFHENQISEQRWQEIKENDDMFFGIPKNNFKIAGKVKKKIIHYKLGQTIFPDDLHSQKITHFILFDTPYSVDLLFHETMSKTNASTMFAGIYKLEKNVITSNHTIKKDQQSLIIEDIGNGPAQKQTSEITRFVRDSEKVTKLKELYQNKCQICGYTFEYKKGKFYSEVHHYNPLYAHSDDDFDNMIVVCPNHHAEFDHKFIIIDRDCRTIRDRQGKMIGEIYFHQSHRLNIKNIESQLDV